MSGNEFSMNNGYANDSFRVPMMQRSPPYHPFRPGQGGRAGGVIKDVYGCVAIPCPIGRNGVYPTGSMAWDQTNMKFQHTQKFQAAFQIFAHGLVQTDIGCPTFRGRPGSAGVRKVQMAFLRALEGRSKPGDQYPLGSLTHNHTFDVDVAEALAAIVDGSLDDLIGRQGGGGDEDEDAILDGQVADDWDNIPMPARDGRGRGNDADEAEGDVEDLDTAVEQVFNNQLLQEGRHIDEKVKVVVVHMTRSVLDEEAGEMRDVDAGCVVFFCILDPIYSMGRMVRQLIEMCEEHRNMRMGVRTNVGGASGGGGGAGAGFKRGRGGAGYGNNTSRLASMFPWITDDRDNTLHDLTFDSYLDLVAFVHGNFELATTFRSTLLGGRGMDDPGTALRPNLLNPINTFTAEWAFSVMSRFGVPDDQLHLPSFCSTVQADDMMDLRMPGENEEGLLPSWTFPPQSTYHYDMNTWRWQRRGYAGLKQQYFPWVEIPDVMLQISSARTESNALTIYGEDDYNLAPEYTARAIVAGMGLLSPMPIIPYDPNSFQRHNQLMTTGRDNRKLMQAIVAPQNPQDNPLEYAAHCALMKEFRRACLGNVQTALVPTAHIPAPFKAIVTFMAREVRKVTTPLIMASMDVNKPAPTVQEMDAFANYIARDGLIVKHYRHIAQEVKHWIMCKYGSWDAYTTTGVSLHYGAIFRGISQTGKVTHTLSISLSLFISPSHSLSIVVLCQGCHRKDQRSRDGVGHA